LDLTVKATNGTGISAAVIVPDQGTWTGASGVSDPGTPVAPEMLFDMASIGKNFVATLVLQLVEEGKLSLDDPLHKWLPDYPNIDNTITIRQLLNHTSGVFDFVEHSDSPFRNSFNSIDFTEVSSPEDVLTTLVNEPYFPPGEGYYYSTTNYLLLRIIVEEITGSKVSVEIRNRFLIPIKLTNTVILDSEAAIPDNFIVAHDWWDTDGDGTMEDVSDRPRTWIATRSPALMYTTAEDMAVWSQALYRGEVLGQESLNEMLTFHRPAPGAPGGPLATGYGLGTGEFKIGGFEFWGHLGWQYGYTSAMMYFPDHSVSIVLLINDNNMGFINTAFFGLFLVVAFFLAKARFIAVGVGILLLLWIIVYWPVSTLIKWLRKIWTKNMIKQTDITGNRMS
jgi:D-alanyl-D-alanine carboxypeptidase